MAERRHKLDEDEIASIVGGLIDSAINYAQDRADSQERAIKYYRAEMDDLPAEVGRSSVVDHTVQDVIGWLLPSLMRTFFASDTLAVYEPKGREDIQVAKQATDYINHIVLGEANAYQVFWDVMHDALLLRNGVFKHYWDDTPETRQQTLEGLSDDQFTAIVSKDEVEVLEHTQRTEVIQPAPVFDFATGQGMVPQPVEITLHDVKVSVVVNPGNIKLAAVPPENFLIDEDARDIETARLVGERLIKTRSELLEMGFNRDDVDKLVTGRSIGSDSVELARTEQGFHVSGGATGYDRATEEIELYEVYPLVDVDGDGIAERLKVIHAGPGGGGTARTMLEWEIWEDEVPYSDLVPERVPHRWEGRSIWDDTEDIQRIKTVLMRGMLDNLYMSNVPDRAVDFSNVDNPDALFDRQIGNVIRTRGDPAAVIRDLVVPFTAQHSFAALEYCDSIIEKRTGVSRSSMGIDPETLQNQTAESVRDQRAASYSKIELIARNFAELGMKRVFQCLFKLVKKHQDRPRTIRLRNDFVDYNPAQWEKVDLDVTINVGLGSGSRDRDMMFLQLIQQKQAQALQMCGGMQTGYGKKLAQAMLHTAGKSIEATGLKSPEMYFPEATPQELAEIAEATGKNPEMEKAQMEAQAAAQMEAAKLQAQMQMQQAEIQAQQQIEAGKAQAAIIKSQAEMQGKAQMEQMKARAQYEIDQAKLRAQQIVEAAQMQADVAVRDRELTANIMLEERKFQFARDLKLMDFELKRQAQEQAAQNQPEAAN